MLAPALELYDAGLSLLAWSYETGSKRPAHAWKDLQRKRMSRERIEQLFGHNAHVNIGVITGRLSGLVVIDADNDEAIDWVTGTLPQTTWTVHTGRGMQFGYAYPTSEVRNAQNVFRLKPDEPGPRVDIRAEGGYVSVPPSVHSSGVPYMWWDEMPIIERVALMPTYEPSWIPVHARPHEQQVAPAVIELDRAYRRASAWIKKRDPAIQGSGGDQHTFITAANLINDFGLNDSQAWALLTAWNQTCSPPWPLAQLRAKLDSAKKSGSAPRGSKRDNYKPPPDHSHSVEVWADAHGKPPTPDDTLPDFEHNDVGNADQLLYHYGDKLRYVHPWEKWLVWDGNRWKRDERGSAMHYAKQAALRSPDPKWRNTSLALSRLAASISIARSSSEHTLLPDMLDVRPFDLNVFNGTVNLQDGTIRKASPSDNNTKLAPIKYQQDAQCPRWLLFLDQIFQGDTELINYIQRAVGYSLTADQADHLFFFCYGTGSNGKTTFLKTLLAMAGDYGKQAPHDLLMEKRFKAHPTELAFLQGLRLAVGTEVKEGSGFDEARLNMLTGADIITARFMRGDFFDFAPTHHLWLAGNHKPRVKATTYGLWRRMRLIPFNVRFTPEQMDRNLPDQLMTELPGILNWAIQGAVAWHTDGFDTPAIITQATKAYQNEENVFGAYIAERYNEDPVAKTLCKTLREDYVTWCEDQGFRPLGARAMGARLRLMGFNIVKSAGQRHWGGLQYNP